MVTLPMTRPKTARRLTAGALAIMLAGTASAAQAPANEVDAHVAAWTTRYPLQELCARVYDELPRYHHVSEGPDHAKEFTATADSNRMTSGPSMVRSSVPSGDP